MPRPSRNASSAAPARMASVADNQRALRTRRGRLIFGGILDEFEHGDRLAGIIPDLPDIERGRMAAERGVAMHGVAIERALQLFRVATDAVADGRRRSS